MNANRKKNQQQCFDIIVIGGGMVGAAFACAMAIEEQNNKLSIAVLETQPANSNWPADSFDIRVSALTHSSQQLLEKIGVWSNIKSMGAYAYQQMQVWDKTGQGKIHFNAKEVGKENLGHIIENRIIQKSLQQQLADFEQISFIHPFKTHNIEFLEEGVVISDDSGVKLSAKLVIGADGANSWLRQQANIDINSWAYQQTALVTTVKTSLHPQSTCWQQFMPTGPLAFLPLRDHYSSIVWSTTATQAEQLLKLKEKDFNLQLEESFGDFLGNIQVCSERAIFPLRMRHARQYVKPHLALIGDAAHTVHPLAGQGVNLGFDDAQALANELSLAIKLGKNPFDYAILRKYERARKGSNIAMLASMDILKRLFSNQNPVLSLLRNTGLNLAGSSSFSRQFFINYALGNYRS
ncbi:MAG: UbiH/UbiF/VisC/COQ6 family ubiquinone biosynthesis hydroxylase [Pseudomonadota bacterium]